MKKSTLLLALACGALFANLARAQVFVGSDDFNSGASSKWDYVYRLNSATDGNLTFSNNRLDFSTTAGAGNQHRLWNSDGTASPSVTASSYTTGWTMTMSATNLMNLGPSEFAAIGFEVYNDSNAYFALMLNSNNGILTARAEGSNFTTTSSVLGSSTDVLLRMSWDATAHTLAAAYSLDGNSYTSVATFNPSVWTNTPYPTSNGFNFDVFGNTNYASAIAVGSMYADNFSLTAVPEPSTYAAFAGLGALGLAFWRRRQVRALAKA